MTAFGYTLSSEEHGPRDLVTLAERAEQIGFDFCSISDHYHPWVEAQGHSPFVWSVLGAIAAATTDIGVAIGVTCPLVRMHPAVVAQAAATASLLLGDRFWFGVGTGEALNEHILGHRWPPPEVRLAMLDEAIQIMRRLWTGETVDHHGEIYTVENARLFDAPEQSIQLIVSGFGSAAAELAGQRGDGYFGHGTDREPVEIYEKAGGAGPKFAQLHVCVGPDEQQCRKTVLDVWPNAAMSGQLAQELPTWSHFEQVSELVTEEDVAERVPCGPATDSIVDRVRQMVDAGYDHVYLHQIGSDQAALFQLWEAELQDGLRSIS
jgi:coenzyme F420-dependent glucose-6-phosphate dehydrogenase